VPACADKYKYMYAPSRLCDHARLAGIKQYNRVLSERPFDDLKNGDLAGHDALDHDRVFAGVPEAETLSGPASAPPGAMKGDSSLRNSQSVTKRPVSLSLDARSQSPAGPTSSRARFLHAASNPLATEQMEAAPPLPKGGNDAALSGPSTESDGKARIADGEMSAADPEMILVELDAGARGSDDDTAALLAKLQRKDSHELQAHAAVLRRLVAAVDGSPDGLPSSPGTCRRERGGERGVGVLERVHEPLCVPVRACAPAFHQGLRVEGLGCRASVRTCVCSRFRVEGVGRMCVCSRV